MESTVCVSKYSDRRKLALHAKKCKEIFCFHRELTFLEKSTLCCFYFLNKNCLLRSLDFFLMKGKINEPCSNSNDSCQLVH